MLSTTLTRFHLTISTLRRIERVFYLLFFSSCPFFLCHVFAHFLLGQNGFSMNAVCCGCTSRTYLLLDRIFRLLFKRDIISDYIHFSALLSQLRSFLQCYFYFSHVASLSLAFTMSHYNFYQFVCTFQYNVR